MKVRLGIVIAVGMLVILPLVTIVWAQVSANFDLSWTILAGGGGQRQSANYLVQDTLGQWAGDISVCGWREVQPGFWYGVVLAPPPCKVSLPLALKNYLAYFEGPGEVEPNNTIGQANGPLRSGQAYRGYPGQIFNNRRDSTDYFSINLKTTGTIRVIVTDFHATGDLVLRDSSTAEKARWGGSGGTMMNVTATGLPPAWYYIQVYVDISKTVDSTMAYTLTATYP
jgi:hypothetical protein